MVDTGIAGFVVEGAGGFLGGIPHAGVELARCRGDGWWLEGQGSIYSGPGVEGENIQRCEDGGGGQRCRGMDMKRLISAKRCRGGGQV